MNERIPDPARGGDILPWAQGVTNVCRRFGGVGTGRMLVREGPGGIGYESLPENRREKKGSALPPGCFDLVLESGDDDDPPIWKLVRLYYRIGHRFVEMSGERELDPEQGGFIVLKIAPADDETIDPGSIAQYEDIEGLIAATREASEAIIPLYEIEVNEDEESGDKTFTKVLVDFRNMPVFVMAEDVGEEDA